VYYCSGHSSTGGGIGGYGCSSTNSSCPAMSDIQWSYIRAEVVAVVSLSTTVQGMVVVAVLVVVGVVVLEAASSMRSI
jgi:hypothetical protein